MAKVNWDKNVGTAAHPVSVIHEYAVALLWERLQLELDREKVGGRENAVQYFVSLPLWDGGVQHIPALSKVASLNIPTAMQPIGGIIPDLAAFDHQGTVVRIFEVITNNPPDSEKQAKLDKLATRGVDTCLIRAKEEADLKAIFPGPKPPLDKWDYTTTWFPDAVGRGPHFLATAVEAQRNADDYLDSFMNALMCASPGKRRQVHHIFEQLSTFPALYPLMVTNPKYSVMEHLFSD